MNIAILGLGVVGRGVYDIIKANHPMIGIKYVLERDPLKTAGIESKVASDYQEILDDKDVDVIVELIGGKQIAYDFVKLALEHGKDVVTANKSLISEHYEELHRLADQHRCKIRFEASVGGAINILDPLRTIARINQIYKIEGIINGSTNFILSQIFLEGQCQSDAFAEAKQMGYIESGSNDDLEGWDLLRKINILSMIAYDQFIAEENVMRVSLERLSDKMIEHIKHQKLSVKYIATSELIEDQVMIHLEPVIIDKNHLYSNINYEENIITIYGRYHEKQSFVGQGAGRYPTASAIVYDLMKLEHDEAVSNKYLNTYSINNNLRKFHFFVQINGELKKTELLSFEEVMRIPGIEALARIDEGAYEKL